MVFISTTSNYNPVSNYYSDDATIKLFGIQNNGNDIIHNEGANINSFEIVIEGIDVIPSFEGAEYTYYDVDDVTLDVSDIGSKTSLTLTSFVTIEGYDAFRISVSGKFELGSTLDIRYRQGLNEVESVNSLDDVPEDASITRLIKPSGNSETSFNFTVIANNETITFTIPMVVKPKYGQAFNGGPVLSASRLGDKGTGHGGFSPRSSTKASETVFINGIGAHREGDAWGTHSDGNTSHSSTAGGGSSTVYIEGKPLARVSDPVACGSKIAQGSETVFSG